MTEEATAEAIKTAPKAPKAPVKTVPEPKAAKLVSSETKPIYAVIATGGKQYLVKAGDLLKIEKLSDFAKASPDKQGWKEGDKISFDSVLMTGNGAAEVTLGNPFIKGSVVSGTLKKIARYKTVDVIKYKQKSRYFKKYGHRQPYFEVSIDSIK